MPEWLQDSTAFEGFGIGFRGRRNQTSCRQIRAISVAQTNRLLPPSSEEALRRKDVFWGLMIKRLVAIIAVVLGLSLTAPSHALDVSVQALANGPFGTSSRLYLSGLVEPGDADKVWKAVRTLDLQEPGASIHVIIDSPGGALSEGLKIGRLLDKLPTLFPVTVTSNVGKTGWSAYTARRLCERLCVHFSEERIVI